MDSDFKEIRKVDKLLKSTFERIRPFIYGVKLAFIIQFFSFLPIEPTYAQGNDTNEIKQLKESYFKTSDVEEKIDIHNELAFQYLFVNAASSKIYADSALALSIAESYEKGIGDSESRLGSYFKDIGELDSALHHYENSLAIRKKINDPKDIAGTYYNIARILDASGRFESSILMFEAALEIYHTDKVFLPRIARTYSRMSEVYKNQGDYLHALEYCQIGLEIRKDLPKQDLRGLAINLMNLGTIYTHMDKFPNAYVAYSEALLYFRELSDNRNQEKVHYNLGVNFSKQWELDSAAAHYQQALLFNEASGNVNGRCDLLLGLGNLSLRKGKFEQANSFLLKALTLAEDLGDVSLLSLCWNNLGETAFAQEEYNRALKYYRKSLEVSNNLSSSLTRGDIYEGMAKSYSKLLKYDSANVYYQLNNRVRDSLLNVDRTTLELEKQLSIALIDKEKKETELELNQSETRNQQIIIVALSIAILLISLIFYYLQRSNKERQKAAFTKLEAENEALAYQKQINDILREQDMQSVQRLLEGQEEERERVSSELHARIGSLLSSLKWNIESIEEFFKNNIREKAIDFAQLNRLMDTIMEEVRNISHNMTSGILKDFGLETAIENLVNSFKGTGIEIQLCSYNFEERLPKSMELGLYRIAQEALGNALKHANASEITIQLNRFDKGINLLIEDNGTGFNKPFALKKKGLGLKNIQNRAKQLGGSADIESNRGTGTTISVDIPFETDT